MPEGRKSEITIRTEMVVATVVERIEALVDEWQVPQGMEEIPIPELKRRWKAMPQEQRDAMMQRPDWPEIESEMMRTGD